MFFVATCSIPNSEKWHSIKNWLIEIGNLLNEFIEKQPWSLTTRPRIHVGWEKPAFPVGSSLLNFRGVSLIQLAGSFLHLLNLRCADPKPGEISPNQFCFYYNSHSAVLDPEKKSLNGLFSLLNIYVIPKSLSRLAIGQVRIYQMIWPKGFGYCIIFTKERENTFSPKKTGNLTGWLLVPQHFILLGGIKLPKSKKKN